MLVLAPVLVLELASSAPVLASESGFRRRRRISRSGVGVGVGFCRGGREGGGFRGLGRSWSWILSEEVEEEDSFAP